MNEKLLNLFLTVGDGIPDRKLRDVQVELLTSLANKWDDTRIHVIQAPVAVGKSSCAMVIQRAIGAHVITPANVLIDQYIKDYPEVNSLKGKVHYKCKKSKLYNCAERQSMFDCRCIDCPYTVAKERAANESSFFNPMSLYYTQLSQDIKNVPVRIIDEAHSLLSLLSQISTKSFAKDKYYYPESAKNEIGFADWLSTCIKNLNNLLTSLRIAKKANHRKIIKTHEEIQQLIFLRTQFVENSEQFLLYEEMKVVRGKREFYLKVAPITVPRSLIAKIFGTGKVILMSGTMLSQDIKELVGDEPYTYHEVDSPIPVEQRPIYFTPTGSMNYTTPIGEVFNRIDAVLQKHPGLNTMIHVTYNMQEQLLPLLQAKYPKVYANTKDDKDEVIKQFIAEGGILLCCGLSEGVDFKDNICRLNIIPKLDFLNLGDALVLKRKALPNGDLWFNEQATKLFSQRYGRSTRNESDWSYTYCLDPLLMNLIRKVPSFPKYVLRSIQVYTESPDKIS